MIDMLAGALLQAVAMPQCDVELVVLGVAQDGGVPQVNVQDDPAWADDGLRRRVVSLGVIDRQAGTRYLFEATPDFRTQLHDLNAQADLSGAPDGIFLTHAHIGHYTGLMLLGFESMSAEAAPVYSLPMMANFLRSNGPWDQLVRYENIDLQVMMAEQRVALTPNLGVTAFEVPHRREYAETAGFKIDGPNLSVIFIPDIDRWAEWDTRIEDIVAENEIVYVDATFFDDHELPGRDMSAIPHPRVAETMDLFQDQPAEVRQRIRFIHYNHTNPIRFEDSAETQDVLARGFRIAREGERVCL
ncbi:MBL fold metallo-hydrolase [Hyphobacterium sp.]|uniref:MBL fold metallo-hydrolase n=1 Tax=Hyphobacterium sp. TaxID=2004662 RepID=UPI003B52C8EE